MTPSRKDLLAELESLRAKYAEADELLHAIRTGAVDGLLVQSPDGPQVYTLKSADQPYRVMVEQMHEGAAMLDVDGLVLYANHRMAELLTVPVERVVGSDLRSFLDPADRPASDRLFAERLGHEEVRLVRADGAPVTVNLSVNALTVDGATYLSVVVTDLTAVKQSEALRLAHAEAQRVSRAKDEFMAIVSHELRTPMTSVLGWASLVNASDGDPQLVKSGLESILQSAKVQARLIDDLLDMSRLESGKLSMTFAALDFTTLVRRAIENLRVTSAVKQLRIDEDLCSETLVIHGDSARLYQVVWNLLSNAFKFSHAGGRVSVQLRCEGGSAELQVSDEGVGISAAYLPKVFERFSQEDVTTTRTFGGLGLGLAIVRHLVAVHGGSVHAFSRGENQGATFTVRLPLAPDRAATPAPRAVTPRQLDGVTVLVLEDDPESREFIAATVRTAGGTALPADTAKAALTLLEERPPDVVVSDIALPEEDGLSFVRKLRTFDQKRGRHTPAIAVSALGSVDDRKRALLEGFDLFLEKPVQAQALAVAIGDILSRQ